jgi:AbrB family looped-hinge helix DNA binding protein
MRSARTLKAKQRGHVVTTMTVILKSKTEITVPKSIRRKAGIKPGDQVEFTVTGRAINITPKLSPDELQAEREIRHPTVCATIRQGYEEYTAGKTRPMAEFLAERAGSKRPRLRTGA